MEGEKNVVVFDFGQQVFTLLQTHRYIRKLGVQAEQVYGIMPLVFEKSRAVALKFHHEKDYEDFMRNSRGRRAAVVEGIVAEIYIRSSQQLDHFVRLASLPFSTTDEEIQKALGKYGEVRMITRDRYKTSDPNRDYFEGFNGYATVRMQMEKDIPEVLQFEAGKVKISYQGQPTICYKCRKPGHLSMECREEPRRGNQQAIQRPSDRTETQGPSRNEAGPSPAAQDRTKQGIATEARTEQSTNEAEEEQCSTNKDQVDAEMEVAQGGADKERQSLEEPWTEAKQKKRKQKDPLRLLRKPHHKKIQEKEVKTGTLRGIGEAHERSAKGGNQREPPRRQQEDRPRNTQLVDGSSGTGEVEGDKVSEDSSYENYLRDFIYLTSQQQEEMIRTPGMEHTSGTDFIPTTPSTIDYIPETPPEAPHGSLVEPSPGTTRDQ